MRIVFMGTPDFAVPSLRALIDNGYDVVGVFCQPDRPKGRGHKLAACPVKETAEAAGIPVFQPERIKRAEGVEALRGLAPDLCVRSASCFLRKFWIFPAWERSTFMRRCCRAIGAARRSTGA